MRNILALLMIMLACGLTAQEEVKVKKITSVEGITEYEIENNGLRVLLFPDKSKETATVNITYKVRSYQVVPLGRAPCSVSSAGMSGWPGVPLNTRCSRR